MKRFLSLILSHTLGALGPVKFFFWGGGINVEPFMLCIRSLFIHLNNLKSEKNLSVYIEIFYNI